MEEDDAQTAALQEYFDSNAPAGYGASFRAGWEAGRDFERDELRDERDEWKRSFGLASEEACTAANERDAARREVERLKEMVGFQVDSIVQHKTMLDNLTGEVERLAAENEAAIREVEQSTKRWATLTSTRQADKAEIERLRAALELISTMNNECVQAATLAYDALHPDSE